VEPDVPLLQHGDLLEFVDFPDRTTDNICLSRLLAPPHNVLYDNVEMLVKARASLLKDKLKPFNKKQRDVLKFIVSHHRADRATLVKTFESKEELPFDAAVKLVDSVVNPSVELGLIENIDGQYTFTPRPAWVEYLESELLNG
jgi:hypothetical protein